jgi:prepilin-type N-terminal cleavage/methylation domain-containing protein
MFRALVPNLDSPSCCAAITHARLARIPCRRYAFSMVELVIVVLVMGIFAAVAIPTFYDSLLFHRVESAARRIKADLELARRTARATSTEQSFTVIGKTYSTSAAVADLDKPTQTYSVDLAKAPYLLDVVTASFGGFTEVRFNGYGLPVKPDGTPLATGTITVWCSSRRCTITLEPTGEVTIGDHADGRRARISAL